ncbi:hypothetical protein J19TS1_17340 [Heyndrickxia oleronia]|nr:hypothetical protein J19TS1_17340 [Heyndrickxia oleronia]
MKNQEQRKNNSSFIRWIYCFNGLVQKLTAKGKKQREVLKARGLLSNQSIFLSDSLYQIVRKIILYIKGVDAKCLNYF